MTMLVAGAAFAQVTFPTRAVRFIVPFPGGGINDILARIIGEKLQAKWGQPIVIENKTGAGGNIGAELAYQSEPDGYTLLLGAARAAGDQPDPLQAALLQADRIRADHPGRLGAQCRDRAQGAAGQLAQGADRLREGEFRQGHLRQPGQRRHPAPHRHDVPDHDRHQDGARAVSRRDAGAAGHDRRPRRRVLRQCRGGALAVPRRQGEGGGGARQQACADLAGDPDLGRGRAAGLVSTGWFGLAGPPKTAPALQAEIAKVVAEAINLPDVQARFRAASVEPTPSTPAEMAAFIKEELRRWGEVIKSNNIVVD